MTSKIKITHQISDGARKRVRLGNVLRLIHRPSTKKWRFEELLEAVKQEFLKDHYFICAETLADSFLCKKSLVALCIHRLRIQGFHIRELNRAAHDSTRDPWYGHWTKTTGWVATQYYLNNKDEPCQT